MKTIIILILLFFPTTSSAGPEKVKEYFEEAVREAEKGKFHAAQTSLNLAESYAKEIGMKLQSMPLRERINRGLMDYYLKEAYEEQDKGDFSSAETSFRCAMIYAEKLGIKLDIDALKDKIRKNKRNDRR